MVGAAGSGQIEKVFLDDIRRNAEDDAPRMVYADWLEEHDSGDGRRAARAEFIRIQCALAGPPIDPERARELECRERKILARHRAEWERELRGLPVGRVEATFRRGFIEGVALSAATFLRCAARLFDLGPIREVQVTECGERQVRALAASPHLARLTSLSFHGDIIGDAGARALAASPHLRNLRSLDLRHNAIGAKGVAALATSPQLANLRSLSLGYNLLGDQGAEALAGSRHFARLTALSLGENFISDDGVRALADSPHLARLTSLGLGGNNIGDDGARALARSPHLGRLGFLDLERNAIGDDGARALEASSLLTNLRSLTLDDNARLAYAVELQVEQALEARRSDVRDGRGR